MPRYKGKTTKLNWCGTIGVYWRWLSNRTNEKLKFTGDAYGMVSLCILSHTTEANHSHSTGIFSAFAWVSCWRRAVHDMPQNLIDLLGDKTCLILCFTQIILCPMAQHFCLLPEYNSVIFYTGHSSPNLNSNSINSVGFFLLSRLFLIVLALSFVMFRLLSPVMP